MFSTDLVDVAGRVFLSLFQECKVALFIYYLPCTGAVRIRACGAMQFSFLIKYNEWDGKKKQKKSKQEDMKTMTHDDKK